MKKSLAFVLSFFLLGSAMQAQPPQLFTYQAVARDALGNILPNRAIRLRMSILDNGPASLGIYVETFSSVTDGSGVFTINVGGGVVVSGDFKSISWGLGSKYLRAEIDVNGGTNYTLIGNFQLLSVPYAFYAGGSVNGGTWASDGANIYSLNSGNVGIGIDTPTTKLQVQTANTLTFGLLPVNLPATAPPPPISGSGSRQFWYYEKSAFRTGGVDDNSYGKGVLPLVTGNWPNGSSFWDKDSIAHFSFGAGYNVLASGIAATAVGGANRAKGPSAVAGGDNNLSTGVSSLAFGEANLATADAAVALGAVDTASNLWAAAIGFRNAASGKAAFAAGAKNKASGSHSTALGENNLASGIGSLASGNGNLVTGDSSIVFGDSNTIYQKNCFVAGWKNQNNGNGSNGIAIGENNRLAGRKILLGAGNLVPEGDTQMGVAIGGSNLFTSSGLQGVLIGGICRAEGQSVAIGYAPAVGCNGCVAMGFASASGSGTGAVAIGDVAEANGEHSLSIGKQTFASGKASIAIGSDSVFAFGDRSTAIGSRVSADGLESTVIGHGITAAGHKGAFLIGDASKDRLDVATNAAADNQFMARFAGGYYLISMNDLGGTRTGVQLLPNGNGWSTISDSSKKRDFLRSDEEALLCKLSGFSRLGSWTYKGQDPAQYRHYGPMAQDFYNAFGHDGKGVIGNDSLINSADMDGLLFTVAHALAGRTDVIGHAIVQLNGHIEQVRAENKELRVKLVQMQAADAGGVSRTKKKDQEELEAAVMLNYAAQKSFSEKLAAIEGRVQALQATAARSTLLQSTVSH